MQRAAIAPNECDRAAALWRPTVAALCASLVGIGLARFAYTPLIPALIEAGWFSASEAVYLGAANLAGYLGGALLARRAASRAGTRVVLRAMMVIATAAFFACAAPLSYPWFFLWRFAAGIAGGALMVLAAPWVLSRMSRSRRGRAGGVIFTGVGLGIIASGTLVPALLRAGLVETWCGLGAVALVLTVLAWGGWPDCAIGDPAQPAVSGAGRPAPARGLWSLYIQYGLCAVGLVPHMVFLVDYIARGIGTDLAVAAGYWVIFGLGAMLGPLIVGCIADRIGFRRTLRLAYLVQVISVAWLAVSGETTALLVSSFVVGMFVPGNVPLVLGRVHEIVADAGQRQIGWSLATIAFALGQAGAAYGFSFLFDVSGSYVLLFMLGAGAFALALILDLAPRRLRG